MSITIFANLRFDLLPKKMVRMVDKYDGLDNAEFDNHGYAKDAEGFFVETEVDVDYMFERNFSNANFYSILKAVDHNYYVLTAANGGCGDVNAEDVTRFLGCVIKARNSAKLGSHARDTVQQGNIIYCGISQEYLENGLTDIMEVCQTAIKSGVGITWA